MSSSTEILNGAYDSTTGAFKSTSAGSAATAVGDGRRVVTTAGTAVALASSSTPCISVAITAEADNTGVVVVGGSTVVAALATRRGIPLAPGETITATIKNLNLLYLDSTVNGDGVTYLYTA